jgi:hypothetical protein
MTAKITWLYRFLCWLLPYDVIPIDGKPYLTRFFLLGRNEHTVGACPRLFLHFFHTSDQGRELHDHPWTGLSLILAGGYLEERMTERGERLVYVRPGVMDVVKRYSPLRRKVVKRFRFNRLGLGDFHRTALLYPLFGCWTLFLAGKRQKSWGFLNRYTREFFPYMSRVEERLGNGPHSRDATDQRRNAISVSQKSTTSVP